ncbi:thioesterase family protein [Nocardia panacis]|uniref:Thioesterase family protein n=1 Tax=Nocardia panacis TaxID=2340916 RepID=A0A3A4KF05_9NOCA|nr:thioesterase family protein [Nocardia panacis]
MRDGVFWVRPLGLAKWGGGQVSGVALCGLLARELERHCPAAGFVPARLTVDMFRAVPDAPIEVRSAVVRAGNRVVVADAQVIQAGEVRTRGTAVFLAAKGDSAGEVWAPKEELPMPDTRLVAPDGDPPLLRSGAAEWTEDLTSGRNPERNVLWQNLIPLVEGEKISPFQRAAAMADVTNLVCHLGTAGVRYINADMTLALSRLPSGPELGLRAEDRVAAEGVAVGTAVLYDRLGRLGTCVVTALANGLR